MTHTHVISLFFIFDINGLTNIEVVFFGGRLVEICTKLIHAQR